MSSGVCPVGVWPAHLSDHSQHFWSGSRPSSGVPAWQANIRKHAQNAHSHSHTPSDRLVACKVAPATFSLLCCLWHKVSELSCNWLQTNRRRCAAWQRVPSCADVSMWPQKGLTSARLRGGRHKPLGTCTVPDTQFSSAAPCDVWFPVP